MGRDIKSLVRDRGSLGTALITLTQFAVAARTQTSVSYDELSRRPQGRMSPAAVRGTTPRTSRDANQQPHISSR